MTVKKGCEVAVNTCMGVNPNDKAVIVADSQSEDIAKKLKETILEITPHLRYFNLDIYGKRPLKNFPKSIKKAADDATVTFWTASAVEGELETIRGPFLKAAIHQGRHAHMVDITEEIVKTGLTGDYNQVEKFTNDMYSYFKNKEEIKVTSDAGTDFTVNVGKYKWVATTGILHDNGSWNNLPDGMVYTVPQSARGTAVIDGTIGDYFSNKYSLSRIENNPVKIQIEDGRPPKAKDIRCDDEELESDIREFLSRNKESSYFGEIGFGTNLSVKKLVGSIYLDEKSPGVNIAFGHPNEDMTLAGWTCPEHLDMVIQNCDVWVDGEKMMENGEYIDGIV